MELIDLKRQIKNKQLLPHYIFTGEELGVMDIYLRDMAESIDLQLTRSDSVAEVIKTLGNNNFISKPKLFIVRDDKDYLKQEKHWGNLLISSRTNDVVILIYSDLDKRGKFYKHHTSSQDLLVTFDYLSPEILAKYIRKDIPLIIQNCEILIRLCEQNYARILLELDKFKMYCKYSSDMQEADVNRYFIKALEDDLFYIPPQDKVFELVNALGDKHYKLAFEIAYDLNLVQDSPLGTISLVYNLYRNMLLIHGAGSTGDLMEKTGLNGYVLMNTKKHANNFSTSELLDGLDSIRYIEQGLKTGLVEASSALDQLLVKLCQRN